SSGLRRSSAMPCLFIHVIYAISLLLFPFIERYAQPYFFSCLIRQEVTDTFCAMLEALKVENLNDRIPSNVTPSDPIMQSVDINTKSTSYAGVAGDSAKDQPKVTFNFRPLVANPLFDGVNISILYKVIKKDGISLIATFICKPIMLDSYTSSMCNDSWGRSSIARCLIKVNSETNLVDVVTISIPSLTGDGFTKETIHVEYEWRPPRCDICKIFGHVHDHCPKKVASPPIVATSNVVTPIVEKPNDGFQTMGKRNKKGKSKSTNSDESNKDVEDIYDESDNLFQSTKTGESSSTFTTAAG
nr:zinc knuckle CX2CX4HX4C [Tanacetum cinerariifolium]